LHVSMFAHLHTYSYYSFLRGLPSPKELAEIAAQWNMPAVALTDCGGLTGAIEFYDACREAGVQPILGLECPLQTPLGISNNHVMGNGDQSLQTGALVLLAMDMDGWGNLCRLSSALMTDPQCMRSGAIPFERLAEDTRGLICLTGGGKGLLTAWAASRQHRLARTFLQRLNEIFSSRLYVEVQQLNRDIDQPAAALVDLANQFHLPLVATHPVHYIKNEDAPLQKLVSAIRLNCKLDEIPQSEIAPPGAAFISPLEMEKRFAALPQALEASLEIAGRCRLELPLGQPHYPQIQLSEGSTPEQALRVKAFAGARKIYGELSQDITDRLEHELTVIIERDYASLFLIMEEIITYAHQADVPVASRGSASSSLVAHCLGITTPDPLRLNLYFERFLNPARSTPPDIDTDLCSHRRGKVIRHVYETYGDERVAMVGTINRFRSRSALRETAKAYGLPAAQVSSLVNALPHRWWGPSGSSRQPGVSPFAELIERYPAPLYQQIFTQAAALREKPHHLSVHAGGVVISPGIMIELAPTQLSNNGIVITQFDLDAIQRLGLVKIDLLGIRGLSVLGDVADGLRRQHSEPQPTRLSILDSIPDDDPDTAQTIRAGHTIGCFQIESPGMRATLREIQAHTVDDVLAALALYRPGPLSGGLKDAFVRRHLGVEPVVHLHPALSQLLGDTHGVILYQEQVLRIAHELAGLSLAEADLLRRAMSHFDPGKQMQTLKEKFLAGALAHCEMPAETAERVWEMMAAFAGYGFPKAHAASYAQISWRSAWCKTHHPGEFMAAVLANWGGYYSQRVYLMEARRLGLDLRPPHINYSLREFNLHYLDGKPTLFMGLDQVKDLTRRTIKRILTERPFHSLEDFLARGDPRPREAQNLIEVGALQGFGAIPELLQRMKSTKIQKGQMALFNLPDERHPSDIQQDWTPAEKASHQETLLGVSVEFHPLELVAGQVEQIGAVTSVDAAGRPGERLRVAGVRQSWRRAFTGRGDPIYFMALEDLEGVVNIIITKTVYDRFRPVLTDKGPYAIEGVVEIDPGAEEASLRAEKIWRLG
jgi:DNA polymerase-3 subunit alpha